MGLGVRRDSHPLSPYHCDAFTAVPLDLAERTAEGPLGSPLAAWGEGSVGSRGHACPEPRLPYSRPCHLRCPCKPPLAYPESLHEPLCQGHPHPHPEDAPCFWCAHSHCWAEPKVPWFWGDTDDVQAGVFTHMHDGSPLTYGMQPG